MSGKWAVMYLCVGGIDFTSIYAFDTWFSICFDSVIYVCFSFYYILKMLQISKQLMIYEFHLTPYKEHYWSTNSNFHKLYL
jgi:hypothetical protein